MFLSVEYHHDQTPRGWSALMTRGCFEGEPLRNRQKLIDNERPPFCRTTVKWRDAQGIFWTIEEWFIKELGRVGSVHILKRDCEAISVEGKIRLAKMRWTQLPRELFLDKAEWLVEHIGFEEDDLMPSWFDIDFLKNQTIICRIRDGNPSPVHAAHSFSGVGYDDDHLHPTVQLK